MLVRKSYNLFLGNTLYALFSLLSVAMLAQILDLQAYGTIRYLIGIAGIAVLFISLGFSQALYYFGSANMNELPAYLRANRLLLWVLSLICLIPLAIRPEWFFGSLWQSQMLIPVLGFVLVSGLASCDLQIMLLLDKAKIYFINVLGFFALRMLGFYIAYQQQLPMDAYLWIIFLSTALPYAINRYCILRFSGTYSAVPLSPLALNLWKYSWPIGVALLMGTLMNQTDRIILLQFFGDATEIAILSNGNFELPLISSLALSFSTIALPSMIRFFENRDFSQILETRHRYQVQVSKVLFPLVLVVVLWADRIVLTIFGSNYEQSIPLFQVYSLSYFLRFTAYHDVFLLSKKSKLITLIQAIELCAHVALTFLGLHFFGLIGASYAILITNVLYAITCSLWSAKILHSSLLQLYPLKSLLITALKSALVIIPFAFVHYWLQIPILSIATGLIAWALATLVNYDFKLPSDLLKEEQHA